MTDAVQNPTGDPARAYSEGGMDFLVTRKRRLAMRDQIARLELALDPKEPA